MAFTETKLTKTATQANEYAEVDAGDPVAGAWPPESLIEAYVNIAHSHRRSEQMDDGRWFAEVVGLQGAWGEGDTEAQASEELLDAIHGWVHFKIERGHDNIPPMEGIDLNGV